MRNFFDLIFIAFIGLALFNKFYVIGILFLLFFKIKNIVLIANKKFAVYFLSIIWALLVIVFFKDAKGNEYLIYRYSFVWLFPFIILIYQPKKYYYIYFKILIYVVFILDLLFNLYSLKFGNDFLGRDLDLRLGLSNVSRLGGLFAHSFYSIIISVMASILIIVRNDKIKWIYLAVTFFNIFIAGSYRGLLNIFLILFFYVMRKKMTIAREISSIIVFSFMILFFTVYSIGIDFDSDNISFSANQKRVYAWDLSIDKIINNPLIGSPYSKLLDTESGVTEETLDANNIGESWYLNSSINFGVPYTILNFLGMLFIFYFKKYDRRNKYESLLIPTTLIDFAYGGSLESLLFNTFFWSFLSFDGQLDNNKAKEKIHRG